MAEEKKVKKEMTFAQVLEKWPKTGMIMAQHGLHCIGCHFSAAESIEQGAKAHGMNEEQLEKMLDDLNKAAEEGENAGKENKKE